MLQTLSLVLDIVRDERGWLSVALEPSVDSEKVDVLWVTATGTVAIQVKSSQNQIGMADAQRWASELETSFSADEYELKLIGPCSDGVIQAKLHGRVKIPTPLSLNVTALIEQAAHKLDHYLEAKGICRVPPFARELLVNALAGRFAVYATDGKAITKEELDRLLGDWLLEAYPQSLNRAVEMQCSLLWSTISVPLPTLHGEKNPFFIAPMTFLNSGVRTTVVQDLNVEVSQGDKQAIYQPVTIVDLGEMQRALKRLDFSQMKEMFSEFAVSPNLSHRVDFVFVPEDVPDARQIAWGPGIFTFRAYGFLGDREYPTLLRERTLVIKNDLGPALAGNNSSITMQFERPRFSL